MYTRHHLTFLKLTFYLPLLSGKSLQCVEFYDGVEFQPMIQYFSHFLMIQNGYSRNILHKQSSIKLCCFSFKRTGILGTNRIHVLLVTNIHEAKVTNEIHFVRMFFFNRWINILWMETYALVNPSNKTDLNWKS